MAAAALAALAVFGLASHSSSGRRAPALPHEQLAGAPQTLASLLSADRQRPVAVVFWASWCGPCTHEAPALERFSHTPAGRGRIVGVDWSDALSGARAFIRRYSWTFPNVRDARRHRRERLPPAGAADHVHRRRQRAHPCSAAWASERTLAAVGAQWGGTQLSITSQGTPGGRSPHVGWREYPIRWCGALGHLSKDRLVGSGWCL